MDFLQSVYSFNSNISIIIIIGIIISIYGAIVGKEKQIALCVLFVEVMYSVLVYLGVKLEYMGVLLFFGMIMALAIGIYFYQRKKTVSKNEE